MNDKAQVVCDCFMTIRDLDETEMEAAMEEVAENFEEIMSTISSLIYDDPLLYKHIFIMNFSDEERINIASDYIGVGKEYITRNIKQRKEIIRLTASMVTYESIAKIADIISPAFDLTLDEVCIFWSLAQFNEKLNDILFEKVKDREILAEQVKPIYDKFLLKKTQSGPSLSDGATEDFEL